MIFICRFFLLYFLLLYLFHFDFHNRILEAVENVADKIPVFNASEPAVIAQKSFAISVQHVNTEEFSVSGHAFSVSLPDFAQQNISSDDLSFERSTSFPTGSIEMPSRLFHGNLSNASKVLYAVFVTDSLFLRRSFSYQRVSSIILSASVVGVETLRGLQPPVVLKFQLNLVRILVAQQNINILFRKLMDLIQNVYFGTNPQTVSAYMKQLSSHFSLSLHCPS